MLMLIVVFGIVGAVLALNARRVLKFCTTATVNGACPANLVCQNGTFGKVDDNGGIKCYRLTESTANCASNRPQCHSVPVKITAN